MFIVSFSASAWADVMEIPRLGGTSSWNGPLSAAAWKNIAPLPLTMYAPENGAAPSEKSDIRVAYDDENLYIAAKFFDSNPAGIHSSTFNRDTWNGDDTLEIVIDNFYDHQTAVHFWVTPVGARGDETIAKDAVGDGVYNLSWNTFWDAIANRDSDGWSAHIRIPFSSFRFRSTNEEVRMGLTLIRFIGRKNEWDIFPARPHKWENALMKPSLTQAILLRNVHAKRPIYFAPYALGGLGQAAQQTSDGSAFETVNNLDRDVGADLKYTINSGLTLDLTANTDFAQVEADDQQLNLTPFAIFLPEKRLFFQERASLFDFQTGRDGRLFYSRRIGLTEDGIPVRIFGGGRLIGKLGDWDLGLMDLETAGSDATGNQNVGVFRVRDRVLNDSSYTGAMVTTLTDSKGNYNVNYGIDNLLQFFGSDYLTFNVAQTLDSSRSAPSVASGMLRAQWERMTQIGWSYRAGYTYSGRDFQPDLGFLERSDFSLIDTRLAYGWEPKNSGVRTHQAIIRPLYFFRNSDHSLETIDFANTFATTFKSGLYFELNPFLQYQSLREDFQLSENAHVPAGNYTFPAFDFFLNTPQAGKIGSEFETLFGKYYDGTRLMFHFLPRLYVSPHFSVTAQYDINIIKFGSRNEDFLGQLLRLRINTAASTHLSFSGFIQYNTADKSAGMNLRFRYNPAEGTDLYIVYNQAFNTDRLSLNPIPPLTDSRSLTFKFVRTFEF